MSSPSTTKTDPAATNAKHKYSAKRPKLTCKWDPLIVLPKNNVVTGMSKAQLIAESTVPKDRRHVTVGIYRNDTNKYVKIFNDVILKSNKIVTKDKNVIPVYEFTRHDQIWENWNKLEYHFAVKVDKTLAGTPTPIKVKRLHLAAVDNSQDSDAFFNGMRASEASNFETALASLPDDHAFAQRFNAKTVAQDVFGGYMLNTYSFNYTGHGAVVCGVCGKMYNHNDKLAQTDPAFLRWTTCPTDATHSSPISKHCASPWWIAGTDISNDSIVPTTPMYLMFSICCGGAFEPSLYNAYTARGTMYAIGFRKATLCTWARDYAKAFYTQWAASKCDPGKIPSIFLLLQVIWQTKLEPVLFSSSSAQVTSTKADSKAVSSAVQ